MLLAPSNSYLPRKITGTQLLVHKLLDLHVGQWQCWERQCRVQSVCIRQTCSCSNRCSRKTGRAWRALQACLWLPRWLHRGCIVIPNDSCICRLLLAVSVPVRQSIVLLPGIVVGDAAGFLRAWSVWRRRRVLRGFRRLGGLKDCLDCFCVHGSPERLISCAQEQQEDGVCILIAVRR